MAILSGKVPITGTKSLIIPAQDKVGGCTITIRNLDNNSSIYLDGESVTPETGFEVKKGEIITLSLSPVEPLYAVTAGTTVLICYIASGR